MARVLLNNDLRVAQTLRKLIELSGFETDVVETFTAALEFLRNAEEPYIVIAGSMMEPLQSPFFDGVEAGGPALRRHVYVAFTHREWVVPEYQQRLFRLGAFAVPIPLILDEFEATLRAAAALLQRST